MAWLPAPSDFQSALRAAVAATDPEARRQMLARLAQHRLGFLELIQLDRAWSAARPGASAGSPVLRLAMLGSATLDHLGPAIRVAGLRRRLSLETYVGGYGQYRQEILDAASPLHRFAPHALLFSLASHDAVAGMKLTASPAEVEDAVARVIDDLRLLWRRARDTFKATVIQQNFLDIAPPIFGNYDPFVPGAPARVIALLNERLLAAATAEAVLLLDIARAGARDGLDAWFDRPRWLQAKMEIAPQAAPLYGDLVARILAAQHGLSRKCLVLDLDNTLWGGVVGDDGIDGLVLGPGSAQGEAHAALQAYAKQLALRGIILAVCSKNDAATAEAAFRDHPEMILRRPDIAVFVANWSDKVENLRRIAERLNIGLDALVVVDDNPAERARIRQSLPMVAVPELSADPAYYVRDLAEAGYFEAIGFTSDDRQRVEQYALDAEREAARGTSESLDAFLRDLGMSLSCGPFKTVDLPRIVQLVNKTNQFNPTTRRYSTAEIAALAGAPLDLTLQFRLSDRFGDNGLVSAMILRAADGQPDLLEIESWVMSCRVFGRQLEVEAMNIAVAAARRRGIRMLRADYIPTARNGVVRELYQSLGFAQAETGPGGATRWSLALDDYVPRATFIARDEA